MLLVVLSEPLVSGNEAVEELSEDDVPALNSQPSKVIGLSACGQVEFP